MAELARRVEIPYSTFQRWMGANDGEKNQPRSSQGVRIAIGFGVDPAWLFDDSQDWPPPETGDITDVLLALDKLSEELDSVRNHARLFDSDDDVDEVILAVEREVDDADVALAHVRRKVLRLAKPESAKAYEEARARNAGESLAEAARRAKRERADTQSGRQSGSGGSA